MSYRYKDATCLVTIGEGKWYSLGLDLEWLPSLDGGQAMEFGNNLQKLLARLLAFPLVTVAALNGKNKRQGEKKMGKRNLLFLL